MIELLKAVLQKQKVWERNDLLEAFRKKLKEEAPQYYFTQFTYGVKSRNKLEENISGYLFSRQRELIPAEEMDAVQQQIIDTIADYSKKHRRPPFIEATFSTFGNDVWGDIVLRMFDETQMPHAFCGFRFVKCKLFGEIGSILEQKRREAMPGAVTFDTNVRPDEQPNLFNS